MASGHESRLGTSDRVETRADKRMFMALVAGDVRAGLLEAHAFAMLATHLHLLVPSNSGDIGETMRRIQNG